MSTRTRSFLSEVEAEDMFPQIFLRGSRSKVDPPPSRRVGRIHNIVILVTVKHTQRMDKINKPKSSPDSSEECSLQPLSSLVLTLICVGPF